jgi:CBS domain-containing protein
MAGKDVGALVVMENEKLVGIFSERDYARKVVLHGKSSKNTTVREMMTSMVLYATPDRTVDDCMEMMTEKHIRHLPVVEDGRVVGIVTIGDVVKTVISKQEYLISHLERYINGNR